MKAIRKDRFFHPIFILLPLAAIVAISEHVAAQSDPKAAAASTTQATFTKDVAPIFQRSCQTCHRPNSFAPMSLLTYEDARPWAKAIKENVVKHNMPPWHIDRNVGISEFANSVALPD